MIWGKGARSSATWQELLQEQRYRHQFLREDGRQNAIVVGVIAVSYLIAARNDFVLLRGSLLFACLLGRLLLLLTAIGTFLLIRRARWPRQHDYIVNGSLGVITLLVAATNATRIGTGQIQGVLVANGALICLLYFALRGPLRPRLVVLAATTATTVATLLLGGTPHTIERPAQFAMLLAFVAVNTAGILSVRKFEAERRGRFDSERRERQAKDDLAARMRELAIEKERAEANSRARAAFLAAMSHEFRTPMNAIIGLSDLVLDAPFGLTNHTHVRAINDSARSLLRLLEDILDFAKIDAQKLTLAPVSFDLRQLAASIVAMLRPAAEAASVDLKAEIDPEVPLRVNGDDARIRQVLVNLIGNAIKFTQHGSVRLKISAECKDAGECTIAFRIEDNGVGMPPDLLARLFRPFEQGDASHARRHGGTGLGLAISKQIVNAMGGDIQVESKPGHGSVFSFVIPLRPEAEAPDAVAPLAIRSRPPLSILVVDDHPINREVAWAKLTRLGYAADCVESAREAIDAIVKRNFDVVFMDLHMPEMNGLVATQRILDLTAGNGAPHIVAMTASVFDEDRVACYQAGMCDFVSKPVEIAALESVLGRIADERGAMIPVAPSLEANSTNTLRSLAAASDPRFIERVYRVFVSSTRERLVRMRIALGHGDAQQLALDAHTLKSASAAVGAFELSDQCSVLEVSSREGVLDGVGAVMSTLENQFVAVEQMLLAELEAAPLGKGAT